ncbi:Alpha/Beta hydrolase protein [Xylariales sp. PMI_506]|nr:Alpha/Beta hydrolase protein [Xylariales sp. PMI_506]
MKSSTSERYTDVHELYALPNKSLRGWRRWAVPMFFVMGVTALAYFYRGFFVYVPNFKWDWARLPASQDLRWVRCYGGKYDCARIDLPMDWLDPSDEERVILAVIRAPAKSRTDYKGPVFINPGGPGGSGVAWFEEGIAEYFQAIIGDNHDIISWDPRGVGASVPRLDCWGSSRKRHDWGLQSSGVVDSHPGVVFDALAQAIAVSRQCEAYMNITTPGLLHHISTASHARDLLEISQKAGYEKIKYWGISYGTILGGTFASMFPDRVERLVSDGNVDYQDWYGNEQLNFVQDADKIMEAFFESCHKAGPERCAFYEHQPDTIKARFLSLLDNLKKSPVLIPAYNDDAAALKLEMPELVTYSKLQVLVRASFYKPIETFPGLARVLAALERGDGLPFYEMARHPGGSGGDSPRLDLCSANDTLPTVPQMPQHSVDAYAAIACADAEGPPDDSPDAFLAYMEELRRTSRYTGAASAGFWMGCAGRRVRPKWRHVVPPPPPHPPSPAGSSGDGSISNGGTNTSFPILFIGNIADNVAPLRSARRNAAAFPGSALLVQRSHGHCSIAAPSVCTARVVRAYFQEGRLPAPGTRCDQDYELFGETPAVRK